MAPKGAFLDRLEEGKIFHTAEPALLKCAGGNSRTSVPRRRANFNPRKMVVIEVPDHTAFACMIREEAFRPSVGPMGALGISSETGADFGKNGELLPKAPPGEMLIA